MVGLPWQCECTMDISQCMTATRTPGMLSAAKQTAGLGVSQLGAIHDQTIDSNATPRSLSQHSQIVSELRIDPFCCAGMQMLLCKTLVSNMQQCRTWQIKQGSNATFASTSIALQALPIVWMP